MSTCLGFTVRVLREHLSICEGASFPIDFEDFVAVAFLFYVQGKHLRSCRDGQLT